MQLQVVGNLVRIGSKSFAVNQISSVDTRVARAQSGLPRNTRWIIALVCLLLPLLWPIALWHLCKLFATFGGGDGVTISQRHVLVLRTGGTLTPTSIKTQR